MPATMLIHHHGKRVNAARYGMTKKTISIGYRMSTCVNDI